MRKFILFLLLLCSVVAFASPCCMDEDKAKTFKVPIKDVNQVNNYKGNKVFYGNGDVPSSVSLFADETLFRGTQYVSPAWNLNSQRGFIYGVITFRYVSLTGKSSLTIGGKTIAIIEQLIVNGSQVTLYVSDETDTYVIEGKEYKLGDVVKGIKIRRCAESLPVVFGDVYADVKGGDLKVVFDILSEVNNKEFIIQGSADGVSFTNMKTMPSNGNRDYIATMGVTFNAAFILPILFFPFRRKWLAGLIIVSILFIGCSKKNRDVVDDSNWKEISFIRIKQIDIDGNFSYSKTVKVNGK